MYRFGIAAAALLLAAAPAVGGVPTGNTQPAPAQQSIDEAISALDEFDYVRLTRDRTYAEQMLRHLDTLVAHVGRNPVAIEVLDNLRALNLAVLERSDEARAIVDRQLRAGSSQADSYTVPWLAAWHLSDPILMLRSVEGVSQNVAPADRGPLFETFDPDMVYGLEQMLEERGLEAERARLAESLVAIGWPGPDDPGGGDYFRKRLVDQRLGQNRRQDATRLAQAMRTPRNVVPMLLQRRYDGLFGPATNSAEHLDRVLAEADRSTAAALRERPDDHDAVFERMEYLRGVGRDEDAVAVARPLLGDVAATVAQSRNGMWIIDSAASALLTLGRADEALALMARLVALDMAEYPDLIGPSINYSGLLWEAGRHEEGLAHAERLAPLAADYANDYGRMWVASYAACSNLALGRTDAANPHLERLKAQPDANAIALNLALLCANDIDASERLVIHRLQAADPDPVLLALQDYRINPAASEGLVQIRQRLHAVRERPAVRAALDRVGRILSLPLSRAYFGTF